MSLKKYDSYKTCTIKTPNDEYWQVFSNDWSFTDIRQWMLDTYSIDESSICQIDVSSTTIYKTCKTHG